MSKAAKALRRLDQFNAAVLYRENLKCVKVNGVRLSAHLGDRCDFAPLLVAVTRNLIS